VSAGVAPEVHAALHGGAFDRPLHLAAGAGVTERAAVAADTIEAQADKCFASARGQTTSGMTECSHEAYIAYDAQLNELYQRVLHSTDAESARLIREAQRRWLAWRQAEAAASNGPWRSDRGSMSDPDIEALKIDAIRERIKELSYYAN